jgi:hypothetical protein
VNSAFCGSIPGLPAWADKDHEGFEALPMPAYLITLHAYRSWGPDKPRGFVRKELGIQPPSDEMARMSGKSLRYDSALTIRIDPSTPESTPALRMMSFLSRTVI